MRRDGSILSVYDAMSAQRNWIVNSLLSNLFITAICLFGDLSLQQTRHDPLHAAIIDNVTHALVGFVAGQLYFGWKQIAWIIGCMLMSSLIDIDHFIAARSIMLSVSFAMLFLYHTALT